MHSTWEVVLFLCRYQFNWSPSPPRADPGPLIVPSKSPPRDSFSAQNSAPWVKKAKQKSPTAGITCLVRMPRDQWKRNNSIEAVSFQIFHFSIIVHLTIFFSGENKVFTSLYTTLKRLLFEVWGQFKNQSMLKAKVFLSDYADMCQSPRTKPPRTKSPGQNPPGQNPP